MLTLVCLASAFAMFLVYLVVCMILDEDRDDPAGPTLLTNGRVVGAVFLALSLSQVMVAVAINR